MKASEKDIVFKKSGMDYVNPRAKVVIVGITPGNSQMKADRSGKTPAEIKRENAFAGGMRTNLVQMLDEVGVNRLLGIETCATLWTTDFDKVHFTSLLKEATYYKDKMYRGSPKILRTPKLFDAMERGFVPECGKCKSAVLYVALGRAVREVLDDLKSQGIISAEVVSVVHPSGLNAGRISVYLGKSPATKYPWGAEQRNLGKKIVNRLVE